MAIQERRIFISDREKFINRSHIEYYLLCEWCSQPFWARRKDAKYCTGACRNQKYVALKNNLL